MERNSSAGAAASHKPQLYMPQHCFSFQPSRLSHRFTTTVRPLESRPPAQEVCKQIKGLPAPTTSHSIISIPLSPTPFPPFDLQAATISISRKGVALVLLFGLGL
jgi:hypothetical protein